MPTFNSIYTGSQAGQYDLQISVTIPSGLANALLVVSIGLEVQDAATVQSVTIDSGGANQASFTKAAEINIDSGYANLASVWYLKDADIPPAGTYNITVVFNWPASVGTTRSRGACSILEDVDQTTPIDATATQTGTSSTGLTTSITTTVDNCMLIDAYDMGDDNAVTVNAGQTIRAEVVEGTARTAVSTKVVSASGSATHGYTHASTNRLCHALIAVAPVATGGTTNSRTVSDAVDVSDGLGIARKLSRSVSDGVTVRDAIFSMRDRLILLSDGLPVVDNLVVSVINFVVNEIVLSDALDVEDQSSRYRNLFRTVTESLTVTDRAATFRQFVRLLANQIDISDSLVRQLTTGVRAVILSDAVSVSDSVSVYRELLRVIDSDSGVFDSVGRYAELYRVIEDGVALEDVTNSERNFARVILSTIKVSADLFKSLDLSRNISDQTEISDAIRRDAIHFYERLLTDTLGVSDTLGITLSQAIAAWGVILAMMGDDEIEARSEHEKIIAMILKNMNEGGTE